MIIFYSVVICFGKKSQTKSQLVVLAMQNVNLFMSIIKVSNLVQCLFTLVDCTSNSINILFSFCSLLLCLMFFICCFHFFYLGEHSIYSPIAFPYIFFYNDSLTNINIYFFDKNNIFYCNNT